MIRFSKTIIIPLIFTGIFLSAFISPHNASALNRLLDFKSVSDGDSNMFLCHLETHPRFSLKPYGQNKFILTLYNMDKPSTDLKVAGESHISINEESSSTEIILSPGQDTQIEEVSSTWLTNENILLIEITRTKTASDQPDISETLPDLKNIRFGFMENATRMVMSLDQEPSWEIRYTEPTAVTLEITAASDSMKEKSYGPIKLIQKVNVNRKDESRINLDLQLESQMNHISIFWMKIGNRLVLDLFNEPYKSYDKDLLTFDTRKSPEGNSLAINKSKPSDKKIIPVHKSENYIRMKIPISTKTSSEAGLVINKPQTLDSKNSFIGNPEIDYNLPGTPFEKEMVQDLDPEEAYIFGRIQQALEINDFKKGIELTNQFLMQFPSSTLTEKVLFWRGDFHYSLWKSGDESVADKVVANYRSAVDHYGGSKHAPLAYIKMAQASSSIENHFPAIGYLSLLISKKKAGAFLPLAYLSRGKIYLKTNQSEKAINDFKKLLEDYPKSDVAIEARFWVANYYHAMGMYDEAEKRLNEIAESNYELYLDYPEYLLLSAKNSLYLEKYSTAREFLFKGLNIGQQPESIDLMLSRIGDTYHNDKDEKEAEKYYRMVIDYYPKSEGASISKLRLADYFSDITMLDDLQGEITDKPLSELALLEKGYQLFKREQYADIMEEIYDLTVKPVQTETRKDAKQLYYRAAEKEIERLYNTGNYNGLIDTYTPIEQKLTNNIDPETVLMVAGAYSRVKLYNNAIDTLLKIKPYDLNPAHKGKYLYRLADAYISAGDRDKAQNLLERYIKDKLNIQEHQEIRVLLAEIYWKKEMVDEAYALYESILKQKITPVDRDLAEIYLTMGKILRIKNKMEKAELHINKAIQYAQESTDLQDMLQEAHMEMGLLHYSNKSYTNAAESFENSFSLGYSPEKHDYWENRFRLASAYIEKGDNSKAAPLLNEISEEGDTLMQQKAQIRIGAIGLNEQIKRLSIDEY